MNDRILDESLTTSVLPKLEVTTPIEDAFQRGSLLSDSGLEINVFSCANNRQAVWLEGKSGSPTWELVSRAHANLRQDQYFYQTMGRQISVPRFIRIGQNQIGEAVLILHKLTEVSFGNMRITPS